MNSLTNEELRHAILLFDKSRGQTGADFVLGKITRSQADSEFEDDIAKLTALFNKQIDYIIGKDEIEDVDLSKSAKSRWGVRARNRVRADQRTRAGIHTKGEES